MGLDCCSSGAAFSGAKALAADVAMPANTPVTVVFTSVAYDTDGYFNLSSDNTLLTIKADGKYLFGLNVFSRADNVAGFEGETNVIVYLNGASGKYDSIQPIAKVSVAKKAHFTRVYEDAFLAGDTLSFEITNQGTLGASGDMTAEVWVDFRGA